MKTFRNRKQDEYLNEIINNLELTNKAFIKASTGFGKTHVYYKLIKKLYLKKF